jgi:NRAMP (natural resistance-associated macrophage protein)-like metal ion transporter
MSDDAVDTSDLEQHGVHQRTEDAAEVLDEPSRPKRALKAVGPGVITGASDDDPSGIATYSSVGASLGYTTLWTALFSLPLMATIQFICAKVALTTGESLTTTLKKRYARWLVYATVTALIVANTINAGTDIGALAAAINILVPIPIIAMVLPIGILLALLQVLGSYDLITKVFKWLTLSLLTYVLASFSAHPDFGEVARATFAPRLSFSSQMAEAIVAILGTTISPYLFFWQTNQEVEELPEEGEAASPTSVKIATLDVLAGMTLSNAVMYFIILSTAATLFAAGQHDVNSAVDAARALEPIAGSAGKYLLAIGLIGSGLLAIPVLTSTSAYALSELLGWEAGLDEKPQQAKGFYAVVVAGMLVGVLVNFAGINPIKALFFTAVINGLLAPPLLALIMLISGDEALMGERVNSVPIQLLGWLTTLVMTLAAIAFVATFVT